jgi:hypothetical protein
MNEQGMLRSIQDRDSSCCPNPLSHLAYIDAHGNMLPQRTSSLQNGLSLYHK